MAMMRSAPSTACTSTATTLPSATATPSTSTSTSTSTAAITGCMWIVILKIFLVTLWDVDAAADAAAAVDAAVAVDAAGAAVGVVAKVDFSWRCAKDALARFAPRRAKMGVDKSSGVGSSIRSLSGERKRCSEVADDEDADFLRLLVLAMAAPRD